jgi:hypothetical protein
MGGVSAFGAPVAGLEPTFFQGSAASRAVDTPPSICTSWGGRVKWAQKGVPATSVYVCACDLGHHQQGGWAVRCCEVNPPTPPAAHTAPTHAARARKWVRGGGARLRLIDAGALTPPPLPTHGPPRGQGGKFERGGGLVGQHSQSGFDYFRQANGLCWLLGLWLRSNKKYLGVSDFGTRECLYLVTTGR